MYIYVSLKCVLLKLGQFDGLSFHALGHSWQHPCLHNGIHLPPGHVNLMCELVTEGSLQGKDKSLTNRLWRREGEGALSRRGRRALSRRGRGHSVGGVGGHSVGGEGGTQ